VHKELRLWLSRARPVTREMIADMRNNLPAIQSAFAEADRLARSLDQSVWANQGARDRAAAAERRRQAAYARWRQALRERAAAARRFSTVIRGRVQHVTTEGDFYRNRSHTVSLVPRRRASFARWRWDGRRVELWRLFYYPWLVVRSGKFGWGRLASTRLSFVRPRRAGSRVAVGGVSFAVAFDAPWDDRTLETHNLTIALDGAPGRLELDCQLDLDGLRVVQPRWVRRAESIPFPYDVAAMVERNDGGIRDDLILQVARLARVRQPFGRSAADFLGPAGTRFKSWLGVIGGFPVILAEQV
jgi:hypothetical protein